MKVWSALDKLSLLSGDTLCHPTQTLLLLLGDRGRVTERKTVREALLMGGVQTHTQRTQPPVSQVNWASECPL